MNDETPEIDVAEIERMLFGDQPDKPERHQYDAVWVNHFWDDDIRGAVFATDIEEAQVLGEANGPEGCVLDSVSGPDGHAWLLSGGHEVCAARVLLDTTDGLVEETIPALTFEMALDLAEAMVGEAGEVLGVQESDRLQWMFNPDEEFYDRPDLPIGWSWGRAKRGRR